MCLALHIGLDVVPVIIPYNAEKPAFNTSTLNNSDFAVLSHFATKYIVYAGAHTGCSCGFRYAMYHNNQWDIVEDEDQEELIKTQINHQDLVAFLTSSAAKKIEIHCCWDGDFANPSLRQKVISLTEILDTNFYFHEGWHYEVSLT
jgi:hypothetical protein